MDFKREDQIIDDVLGVTAPDARVLKIAMRVIAYESMVEERERCAKLCDDMVLYTGFDCAQRIRTRPNVGVEPVTPATEER